MRLSNRRMTPVILGGGSIMLWDIQYPFITLSGFNNKAGGACEISKAFFVQYLKTESWTNTDICAIDVRRSNNPSTRRKEKKNVQDQRSLN